MSRTPGEPAPVKASRGSNEAWMRQLTELSRQARAIVEQPGAQERLAETLRRLPPTLSFDVIDRLRVLTCGVCQVSFAAAESVYLHHAQEQLPIYCPAGHA